MTGHLVFGDDSEVQMETSSPLFYNQIQDIVAEPVESQHQTISEPYPYVEMGSLSPAKLSDDESICDFTCSTSSPLFYNQTQDIVTELVESQLQTISEP